MDNLSDQLQSKVFQYLVDLTDFQNCRLVSQKWRRTVVEACRDKFHVVYPLTDSTLHAASELKDAALVSFDIYAFTGEETKDAWRTSGIERLMQTTEWLQFSGSQVKPDKIRKILNLAHNSLKTLYFTCIETNLMQPLLQTQETFSALRKISFGYYSIAGFNDTFTTFTNTLEKWNSLDCRVQLPLLESLNLYFSYHTLSGHGHRHVEVTTSELFRNYVAIAKLLLKYKQTLREVQIERFFAYCVHPFKPELVQPEWNEMERGLEALDELNLNQLKLSTKLLCYYAYNNDIVTQILGRPKNMKNVLFNNLICPLDTWCTLSSTLSSFNNIDGSYLTSLKISFVLSSFPDPTMAINLGGLKECRNLRTLWLSVNAIDRRRLLSVRNLELLPKGISSLRFENTSRHWGPMGKEIILNQQQIRWIIDNLRELESCRMSLLIPEQTNANENNERREGAGAENNEDANDAQAQEQEEVNRLVNINLDTFRNLIDLPALRNLEVDMMTARAFSIFTGPWQAMQGAVGRGTTLEVIRQYSNLCEAAGCTTTTTRPLFGADDIFGFATLAIQRNQN